MRTVQKSSAKKVILPIVAALLVLLIAALTLFFGCSVYRSNLSTYIDRTGEHERSGNLANPYAAQTPLNKVSEAELVALWEKVKPVTSGVLSPSSPNTGVELPFDLHYYADKADTAPSLTLKKGTRIYPMPEDGAFLIGYGYESFPDYDAAWRYGAPFAAQPVSAESFSFETATAYYVKTDDLIRLRAYSYDLSYAHSAQLQKIDFWNPGYKAQLCFNGVFSVDATLFTQGVFNSPALHRTVVLWG